MTKKKSPLEPPVRRKRAYELDGMTMIQAPQDPLRQIENQAISDLSNEYRQLRIEEMIQKKRKQLSASGIPANIQNKENLDTIKTLLEIQKMSAPEKTPDRTLDYLKFFTDLLKTQGQPISFWDEYGKMRELGLIGHNDPGEPNKFSVEMEKLRGERMLTSKKIDLELQKMRLEQEDGRNKLGMLAQFLSPFVAIQGSRMADNMRLHGQNTANTVRNPGSDPAYNEFLKTTGIAPETLQGETAEMQILCDCGYDKIMIVPNPPPPALACPGCGKILTTGPPPSTDEETEDNWMLEE